MSDPAVLAYSLAVAVVVAAHLVFLGYLVIGGWLAWRWPRTLWLHAVVVVSTSWLVAVWRGWRRGSDRLVLDLVGTR